ncbi:MAG: GNAT family N-acetyltransferase [Planctomycetota bacterium]|nr:GNAT family N-acetyltransferase [Planctomycetota bacterium]
MTVAGRPLADEALAELRLRSLDPGSALELTPEQLAGFFVGWPSPPSPARFAELLAGSAAVEVCQDTSRAGAPLVGVLTGLTDGVLFLYLPLLEVLPTHQGRGIARRLVERMLARFGELYAIDLVCDEALRPFYEGLGLRPLQAMALRRYEHQAGR